MDHLLFKGRPPSLQEIGVEADISRERARFYVDRLQEKGHLIRLGFKRNQKILFPALWIEKHTKKSLKKNHAK